MMQTTISKVMAACNAVIAETFPGITIYADDVHDGVQRPSFFCEIRARDYRPINQTLTRLSYEYILTYFEQTHDAAHCLDVIDKIREAFGLAIKVDDRKLVVEEIDHEWIGTNGDMLQVTIDFAPFVEAHTPPEDGEIMETLDVSIKQKGDE